MYYKNECLITIKILIILYLIPIAFENYNYYRRAKLYITRRIYKLLFNEKERKEKDDLKYLNLYNKLIEMPKNPNDPLIEKERKTILKQYYSSTEKTNISIVFDLGPFFGFGNKISAFNKLLFYCGIIKCQNIILLANNNMFINHTLYDKDYNITILYDSFPSGAKVDYIKELDFFFFYDFFNFKIENRLDIIKNEIVNNLPKIEIKRNDLVIHMRSSDVFQFKNNPNHAPDYAQPPLCFYEKILNNNTFEEIYLLSVDDEYNPIIKILKKKYPKIIYNKNPLEIDLSYLVRGYNIISSISSLVISSIKLNDNLQFFWEFDRYPLKSKIFHSHYSIVNITRKYTVYQMEPSEIYKTKMVIWKDSDEQIEIMLNDTCPNDFKIIPPNI